MLIKSSKLYDATKWIALVGLPGAGTLYASLAAVWNFQDVQAVAGTVLAVDTFLGVLLHLSSSTYKASDAAYDGHVDITVNPDGTKVANFNPTISGNDLVNKDSIAFKVNSVSAPMPVQASVQPVQTPLLNPGGSSPDEVEHNGY